MVLRVLLYSSSAVAAYHILRLAKKYWRWYFSPLWKLPGPKRSFLLGTFPEVMKEPFMVPHTRWWEEAGKEEVDIIHYNGLFGHASVLLFKAEHVRTVLMSNHRLPRFWKNFRSLEQVLGKGLVTLEGEDWHRHRRILHPSFQEKFLKARLDATVPSRVEALLECWQKAGKDRAIDLSSHFSMVTLDILGEIAFAHDFNGMGGLQQWASKESDGTKVPPVSDRLIASLNASMRPTGKRFLLNILGLNFLDWEARRTQRNMNEAVDEVVRNARERYEKRNQSPSSGDGQRRSSTGKYEAKSVLELMLDAKDTEATNTTQARTLNDTELRDEVKTFLIAGHETTSTWCYWAVYCLCKYPEIQEKVFEEISEHIPTSGETISLDVVEKMKYFDAFLKEVLRLYSPVGMLIRSTAEPETFGDVTIPPHTRVVVPTYILHRNPRYWKDPLDFQPERWMGKIAPYSNQYAYLPFSVGPRNCIGYRFATMEAKLILAPILRQVRFQLTPELRDANFKLTSYVTVKAKPAVQVNAIFRQEEGATA